MTLTGPSLGLLRKQEEQRAHISSEEIVQLAQKWGLYWGRSVTEDRVRAWLNQFPDNRSRRLMFQILRVIRFYGGDAIRTKLAEAHGIVSRAIVTRLAERKGQRKRGDIVVSYLDGPGKSGSHYARLYAQEADIYYEHVIERSRLSAVLAERDDIQALVFVDDFIGTGSSGVDYLRRLVGECPEIRREGLQSFFVAIAGFEKGQARIEGEVAEMGLQMRVCICEPLTEADRCFSDQSAAFPDRGVRDEARSVALKYGGKLVRKNPLGFGDCQAAVVFENSCPNNSLPILWAEDKNWRPLFPRL
jgi:hypothetical protein